MDELTPQSNMPQMADVYPDDPLNVEPPVLAPTPEYEEYSPYGAFEVGQAEKDGFATASNIWEATGEAPTFGDVHSAFFRQETILGAQHHRNTQMAGTEETEEEYQAWLDGTWRWDANLEEDDILYEHPEIASQARNDSQLEGLRRILMQEREDDQIFANASLGKNILAGISTVPVDPTQWPLFLIPGAQGTLGIRFTKGAGIAFADSVAREAALADIQGTRTLQEGFENVTVTTILGGIFGGALGRSPDTEVHRSATGLNELVMNSEGNLKDALDQNFTKAMREKYGEDVLEWNSELGVNRAENEPIDLTKPDEVITINKDLEAKIKADDTLDEAQKEGYLTKLRAASLVVKDEKIMKATLTGLNKQGKMLLSESPTVRLLAYSGLETPHVGKYFDQASLGHSALTMSEVISGKMTAAVRRAYKKAVKD